MSFCSPTAENKVICYSQSSLLTIAKAWNYLKPKNKIDISNPDLLFENIQKKMGHRTWAYVDIIRLLNNNKNAAITELMSRIEHQNLRPSQPMSWVDNKTEWLSNIDIEKVLRQYEKNKSLLYKFHGVFTIDFGIKLANGKCKYDYACDINMKKIISSGHKFFGFVTNLCKYDEPGYHWTSSFFVLDPNYDSYGAYYYDSVKRPIPKLLKVVFDDIKRQMEAIYPDKKFTRKVSNVEHQKSNTECGIFSITFQTRWLLLLKKEGYKVKFADVINYHKMNDSVMKALRFKFFRPNITSLLKN
jgi:hypothetical protein